MSSAVIASRLERVPRGTLAEQVIQRRAPDCQISHHRIDKVGGGERRTKSHAVTSEYTRGSGTPWIFLSRLWATISAPSSRFRLRYELVKRASAVF